jgi:hypothetical protein
MDTLKAEDCVMLAYRTVSLGREGGREGERRHSYPLLLARGSAETVLKYKT